MSAVKENPFNAKRKKKPLQKFGGGKKRMLSTTDAERKGRTCPYKKGMKVRMTWKQYPEFGGKHKMAIGEVIDVQWTKSGATVVFKEKNGGVMRHALFAPGNATMKAVKR